METTDTVLNMIQMEDIMNYDVFLSYPHADHEELMQICEGEVSGMLHFLWLTWVRNK